MNRDVFTPFKNYKKMEELTTKSEVFVWSVVSVFAHVHFCTCSLQVDSVADSA